MAFPRTERSLLALQGNESNLRRSDKRAEAERRAPALPADRQQEIREIDALIAKTLKACGRGSTRNRKSNPAFSHLALLVRVRAALVTGVVPPPKKQSVADLLSEVDSVLGDAN